MEKLSGKEKTFFKRKIFLKMEEKISERKDPGESQEQEKNSPEKRICIKRLP